MKKTGSMNFLILTVFFAAILVTVASRGSICTENSKPCMQNSDCCDGCCFKDKCVSYADNCVKENSPCSVHECPPNTVCYLQQVQCIQAPCPPIPACRPLDYDYD